MSNLHRSRVCKKAHQFFQTNCGDNPLEVVNVQRDIWVYRYTPLLKDKLRWCVQHIQLSLKKVFNYEEILLKYYSMFKKWYMIYIYIINYIMLYHVYTIFMYTQKTIWNPHRKNMCFLKKWVSQLEAASHHWPSSPSRRKRFSHGSDHGRAKGFFLPQRKDREVFLEAFFSTNQKNRRHVTSGEKIVRFAVSSGFSALT